MRILYVNTLFPTPKLSTNEGGAETFSLRLCHGLTKLGHQVAVVRSGTDGADRTEEVINGISVYTMALRNVYPPWPYLRRPAILRIAWHLLDDLGSVSKKFSDVIKTFKPDVVHTNNLAGLTTNVWKVAQQAQVPVMHTLHDYYLTCPKAHRFRRDNRCQATCASCIAMSQRRRRATEDVNAVVGVSQRILDIHRQQGLFLNQVSHVILNLPAPRPRATAAPRLTVNTHVIFGYIGRTTVQKGIFELLEAFRTLPRGLARLIVAGDVDGETRAWIETHAADKDITLLGFVPPDQFFPKVDTVIVPSLWEEPCPMVIGEALSFGCPVIGARRGGIPELLQDPGVGWLFEPGTPELASLLSSLAENPELIAEKVKNIGINENVSAKDKVVSSYETEYRALIQSFRDNRNKGRSH